MTKAGVSSKRARICAAEPETFAALPAPLLNLGSIAFADGDVRRAHLLYLQSLKLLVSGGGATPVATDLLEDLSGVLLARGESSLAVRMLGAVDAFRRAICMPEPGWRQSNLERMLRQLTQAVDPETYASLWAEGRKLRIEQAMSEVLASSGPVRAGRGGLGQPTKSS